MIFRKTEERTNVWEHTNLILDKSLITDYFEKNNPIFKKIWELFKKSSWCERYYIWKEYFPSEFHKLKENMLIDLYEDSWLWRNKISNIWSSDKMIIDYVWAFIQKNKDNIEKIKNTY